MSVDLVLALALALSLSLSIAFVFVFAGNFAQRLFFGLCWRWLRSRHDG